MRPPYAVGERLDCWGPLIDNPEETYKCFNKECLKVNDPAKAKDRTNRGTFRHYDTDHSGTIELDELQRAVAAYIEVERADPAVARPKAVQTPTPLTVGFVQTDYRRLRGTTPPAGSLRSFQGLTASCR